MTLLATHGRTYFVGLALLFSFRIICCDSSSTSDRSGSSSDEAPLQKLTDIDGMTEKGIDRGNIVFDRDLNLTCDKLRKLDVSLTQIIKKLPEGWGEEFLKQLRLYNTACLDLLELLATDKLKVLSEAEDILEPGGPTFFDIQGDEGKMRKRFEWDDDQMDEFNGILNKSYDHWKALDRANNNFNTN